MKAVEMQKLTIKCDSCEFNQDIPIASFKEWHHKKCPNCDAVLVDDSDIEQFEGLVSLSGLVNKLMGDVEDGHTVTTSYDSAAIKQ